MFRESIDGQILPIQISRTQNTFTYELLSNGNGHFVWQAQIRQMIEEPPKSNQIIIIL